MVGVVVIAGTSSGVGKTTLSVGLMAALRQRGLTVQAFKVGPDFLDPLHHEAATGRPSINLDGWMMDQGQNAAAFHRATADADVAVVEGVMGLFDGRDGASEAGSTAQMAKWLGAPVLLVLDCWALARSAAAMVKGFTEFDEQLRIGGLLLNRVGGAAHSKWLQDAISGSGVKADFLGGIPKDDRVMLKERYLGLHMPGEEGVPADYIERLAALLEANVDMEALLAIANSAAPPPPPAGAVQRPPPPADDALTIAVAQDAAFGFYYQENLALLEVAGARLVRFSPMEQQLPAGISGLYLGGGYPERHSQALAANRGLKAAIAAFAHAGGVVYAECGGLMYLSQSLQPLDNLPAAMVGIFPFRTVMTQGKMKMGYVEVETQPTCRLFPPGAQVRGHVFHFSEMVQEQIVSGLSGLPDTKGWDHAYRATMQTPGAEPVEEGYASGNVLASYVHLHFGSAPEFADALVSRCREVDVAAADSAARSAAEASSLHRRGSSDTGISQGSGSGRARHSSGQLAHVRSVPNLADAQSHARHPRRGRTHSEHSSGEEETQSAGHATSSGATSPASFRRHSSDSRHEEGLWPDSRDLKGLVQRPGSPATTLQQIASMNDLYSPSGSPSGTPPNEDYYASGAGRQSQALWEPRQSSGSMSRSASGMLPASSSSEPLSIQRSASAMSPSAFAVPGGRPSGGLHGGKSRPVNLMRDQMHPSASVPDHMDKRQRQQHRTWPGAGGRASGRLPNGLSHSRSAPLPNDSIVSLLPSGTEVLFALGLGGRVVGVSDQCDWPPEAAERPAVSRSRVDCRNMTPAEVEAQMQAFKQQGVGAFKVDEAALAALAPGLVLTQDACPTCDADADAVTAALQRAGLLGGGLRTPTCVLNLAPRTLADALETILEVGHAAGVAQEAGGLVERLRARLRAIAAAVSKAHRRPRVLSLEGLTPLVLGGQWLPDVKELAGGSDEWQQAGDPPLRITWDQVRAYAPEVLILSPCGAGVESGVEQACGLAALPGWWALPAVRSGRVFVADHSLFSRPGPRLVDGVEALARMLHPNLIAKRVVEGTVRKLALSGGQRCRQSTLPGLFVPYA